MFELENEIAKWKQAVIENGVVNSEDMSELESHLRESVESLCQSGLTDQEAFLVGANRIGHPVALQNEYEKNNLSARWRQRVFWMLAGYLGFRVIGSTVSAIATVAGAVMAYGGFGGSASGVVMIAIMVLAWGSIFTIAFRERQRFGTESDSLPLKWMIAIGAVLVVAPSINMVGRAVQASLFATATWYGEAAIYLSIGGIVLNLCVLTLCFVTFYKLNDRSAWNLD